MIWNKENNDIKFKLISSTDVNKIKSNIKKLNYTEYFKNNDNDTNNDYSEFRNYNLNLIKKISKQTRNELNIYLKNLDKL